MVEFNFILRSHRFKEIQRSQTISFAKDSTTKKSEQYRELHVLVSASDSLRLEEANLELELEKIDVHRMMRRL
eukprot:snap_masked-scaffold_1-processed-gene-22.21-mRNA-1 protein AED:1.00 eAED:1.00 QI:0/0/0/0/1/1/2/0/72